MRLEEKKRGDEVKERVNSERKEAKEEKKRLEEKNERELEVEWKGKLRRLAIESFQVVRGGVELKEEATVLSLLL